MTTKISEDHSADSHKRAIAIASSQEGTQLYDSPTPDGYDAHIIPAETAARKEREGDDFKHLHTHEEGPNHEETTGGFTVDKEGLVDNFAIEPEIYYETPGDLAEQKFLDSPTLSLKAKPIRS